MAANTLHKCIALMKRCLLFFSALGVGVITGCHCPADAFVYREAIPCTQTAVNDATPVELLEGGVGIATSPDDFVIYPRCILTRNGVINDMAVRVQNGRIVQIFDVDDDIILPVIFARDHILSPGFINTHDHLDYNHVGVIEDLREHGEEYGDDPKLRPRYSQRHDWRKGCRDFKKLNAPGNQDSAAVAWNELRQLISGTTTIVSDYGTAGFVRNLGATNGGEAERTSRMREGLDSPEVRYDIFPLGDRGSIEISSCAYQAKSGDSYPVHPTRNEIANLVYIAHVAEGVDDTARNEYLNLSSDLGKRHNILGENVGFIHLMALLPKDIEQFSYSKSTLIWSPSSNISLYGDTAHVTLHRKYGTPICLSSDWAYSGSINLLDELEVAQNFIVRHADKSFTGQELWEMVTVNPAKLLKASGQIGDIGEGMFADLVLFKADASRGDAYSQVVSAKLSDVGLVVRGGRIIYGDERLITPVLTPGMARYWDRIPDTHTLSGKVICTMAETMDQSFYGLVPLRWDTLQSKNIGNLSLEGNGKYPCPTPIRGSAPINPGATVYPLAGVKDDFDRDGMPDARDTSPRIFNPVRPVDVTQGGGRQPIVE